MKKIASIVAAAALIGSATAAQAWNGPWGGNMFGMDMGQSAGYPAYYGAPVPPVAAPAPVTK